MTKLLALHSLSLPPALSEEIDRETLPSFPLKKRHYFPKCCCIYFICNQDGSLLYIGKTTNLYNRYAKHTKLAELVKSGYDLSTLKLAWLECSITQLDALETKLIWSLRPIFNLSIIPPHQEVK